MTSTRLKDAVFGSTRRLLVVVVTTLLGVGLALAYVAAVPAPYAATARVVVQPLLGNALSPDLLEGSQSTTVAMGTEAALVSSPEVTALVNDELGSNIDSGSKRLRTTVPVNTLVVEIQYTGDTPTEAQRFAQAFAKSYLQFRTDRAERTRDFQLSRLRRQEEVAQRGLDSAARALEQASPPPDARSRVDLYAARLANVQESIGEAETVDVEPGSIISPAVKPGGRSGLSTPLLIVLGGLLGLGLGVAGVWLRVTRRGVVHAGHRVEVSGIPVVATVPADTAGEQAEAELSDAYRHLRIGVVGTQHPPATLAVTAAPGASSSTVSLALAMALKSAGYDVQLIDASADTEGDIAATAGSPRPGLSDFLRRDGGKQQATIVNHDGVDVIHGGRAAADLGDLLASPRLRYLVDQASGTPDYRLIATPPLGSAEALACVAVSDSALVVVVDEETHLDDLDQFSVDSHRLGTEVMGAVIQRGPRKPRQTSAQDDDPATTMGAAEDSDPDVRSEAVKRTVKGKISTKPSATKS